jgi:nicotinamidase-related amidase
MLHYFADPDGRVYLPSTAAIIPRIALLLKHWRMIGGTVVYTRHCHSGSDDLGMLGKFFSDYIRCGKKESEIIPELSPLPAEKIFRKNTYDAFYNTDLDEFLRSRSVEQVLITGVLTQMCCETTARSAFVRGYEVYIPADAQATSSEELHIGSLLNLASGFAVITDTPTICSDG